jgi:hypothetical protein
MGTWTSFEVAERTCQRGKMRFVEAILPSMDTKSVAMCPQRTSRWTSPSSMCPRRTALVRKLSSVASIVVRSSSIAVVDGTLAVVDGRILDVDVNIDAHDAACDAIFTSIVVGDVSTSDSDACSSVVRASRDEHFGCRNVVPSTIDAPFVSTKTKNGSTQRIFPSRGVRVVSVTDGDGSRASRSRNEVLVDGQREAHFGHIASSWSRRTHPNRYCEHPVPVGVHVAASPGQQLQAVPARPSHEKQSCLEQVPASHDEQSEKFP